MLKCEESKIEPPAKSGYDFQKSEAQRVKNGVDYKKMCVRQQHDVSCK